MKEFCKLLSIKVVLSLTAEGNVRLQLKFKLNKNCQTKTTECIAKPATAAL